MKTLTKFAITLALSFLAVTGVRAQDLIANVYGREMQSLNGKWDAVVDLYDQGRKNKIYLNRKSEGKTDFYEYAISQKNGCLVCSIYFQNLLKKNGIDFENFAFTPKEEILIEYGQAIAEDPKHVPEELFAKLKANFTEEEIVVITAMGVMMIANNYFNDILDVTPDKLV